METTIALKNPIFYISGIGGVSPVVGYESNSNRVARYEFSTEASGASTVSLLFKNNWPDGNNGNPRIRFFIGADPESHSNAGGPSFAYSGELAYEESGVYVNYSGSADVLLMPSTKYYLWLFPAEETVKYVLWNTTESGIAQIKLSGGAFSTIDPQTVTIGMQNILSVKRYNSSFTHTIEYSIGSDTGVICEKSSSETIKWTPEFEIARQIPNSESGPATIKITTYSGNKEIGQQSVVFLLVVHPTVVPSIALFWKDESIASTAFEVLTQSVSFLSVTPTTYGIYGSTIKSTEVFFDGEKYNGGIIEKYGDLVLSAKTTDSRGRSNTASLTLHIHKYEKPQIKISASRCDEDGTPNDGGEFAAVKINAITTQVNNKNTSTINLQYGDAVEVIEADVGSAEIIKTIPAPSTNALQILAIVQDKLGFSASQQMKLSAGYATMDFLAGGKGVAFGITATREGFECAMPAFFTGPVSGVTPYGESTQHPGCFFLTVNGETEWLNPPMETDREYRTAERFMGKPVYTKILDFGNLPNAAQKEVAHGIGDLGYPIHISGTAKSSDWSFAMPIYNAGITEIVFNKQRVIITTTVDWSGYQCHVLLKYTKT